MFFPRRLTISRSYSRKPVSRKRHSRRRTQQDSVFSPRTVCCGPSVEELEGRQMLSAALPPVADVAATTSSSSVAHTNFVIAARLGSNPTPADTPNDGPDNAPAPYTPLQMQTAYGISTGAALNDNISFTGIAGNGKGETIAIVDAYNDPGIFTDTATFDTHFNLPQFNQTGGPTLTVLGESGTSTLPTGNDVDQWDIEESLDVQWVHSIAPEANVILYEANSNLNTDLETTEQSAVANPAVSVISNSWGTSEDSTELQQDSIFTTPAGHQGITFLASTGDSGSPSGYPALLPMSSPSGAPVSRFKPAEPGSRRRSGMTSPSMTERPPAAPAFMSRSPVIKPTSMASTARARSFATIPTSLRMPIPRRASTCTTVLKGATYRLGGPVSLPRCGGA